MNLLELLKNTSRGTKLYSPAFGKVKFKCIYNDKIVVEDSVGIERLFHSNGNFYVDGECMLFPSRENRDWNTFIPFKKGDILISQNGNPFIFNGIIDKNSNTLGNICGINIIGRFVIGKDINTNGDWTPNLNIRKATEKERDAFIFRINQEGYYWNSCTCTLKSIKKFNISELKPFDKVLVRDSDYINWKCGFFDSISDLSGFKFRTTASINVQCIPYNDETKHLVGTKEPCPEYYKTW